MSALEADDWRQLAECLGIDPDIFYPERGDNDGVDAAKAICARCPVEHECLEDAIATREMIGVRGGKSGKERRAIVKERGCVCVYCGDRFPYQSGRVACGSEECDRAAYRARQERYHGRPIASIGVSASPGKVVGPAQRQLPGPVPTTLVTGGSQDV